MNYFSFFPVFFQHQFRNGRFCFQQTIIYIETYSSKKKRTMLKKSFKILCYILLFVKRKIYCSFERNKIYKIHTNTKQKPTEYNFFQNIS